MSAGDALADAAAAFRLTRLLVADEFPPIAAVREWVIERSDGGPLSYLVTCPYCMGVWVGLGIAAARKFAPGPWGWLARALALAAAASTASLIDTQLHDGLHLHVTQPIPHPTGPRAVPEPRPDFHRTPGLR